MAEENETKEALEAAIAEATTGLKAKNEELLGKLKKEKDGRLDLQKQIDELADARQQAEEAAATKDGDIEKLRSQLEARFEKDREKFRSDLEAEKGINRTLLVDNGLTNALTGAGVKKEFVPAVKSLIQSANEIDLVDADGQRSAQINGQGIKDFVALWAQSDQGKHFVAAPENSGGGANGSGNGTPQGKTMKREAFNQLHPREQSRVKLDGVQVID